MAELDLKQIRIKNLVYLCDKHGRDAVRLKCGYEDANYFNQLYSGFGSFGPRTASKIEKVMSKPSGWMSEAHPLEWGEIESVSVEEFEAKTRELKALADLLPEDDNKKQAVLSAISLLSQL